MPFSDEAAPMKFAGIVEVAVAEVVAPDASPVAELVPTAVGRARVVLLYAGYVEVTDATTWETVIVRVIVAVEVMVVVEEPEDCATARRGRRRSVEMVGSCIFDKRWSVLTAKDRAMCEINVCRCRQDDLGSDRDVCHGV